MTTSLSATIVEILERIFGADRQEFLTDPEGYLEDNGLGDISCNDFDDVLGSFLESGGGDSHGDSHDDDDDSHGSGARVYESHVGHHVAATVPAHGQSDHEAIAAQLVSIVNEIEYNETTNNFVAIEDNSVTNDSSFHGDINAEGDVDFDNSIVSASDDGVAVGGDVEDSVLGSGNVVGDGNRVGDGSAFGEGSQVGDSTVIRDSGNDSSVNDSGNTEIEVGDIDASEDNSTEDNDEDNDTVGDIDNSTDDDGVDVDIPIDGDVDVDLGPLL